MRVITDASSVIQAQAVDDSTVASTLLPLTNEIASAAVVYTPSPASGVNYSHPGHGHLGRRRHSLAEPGGNDIPVRTVGGGGAR